MIKFTSKLDKDLCVNFGNEGVAQFNNGCFETEDDNLINALMHAPCYGREFEIKKEKNAKQKK